MSATTPVSKNIKKTGHWKRNPWTSSFLMILPALALLLVFYFYPLIKLIPLSLFEKGFTLKYFIRFFSDPLYYRTLLSTLKLCLLVTLCNLAMGYPVAYLLSIVKPRTATILFIFVIVPFWMSILVRTYAWMVLLQRNGIINNLLIQIRLIDKPLRLIYTEFAISLGMIHILLPFMVLPIFSVLKGIDPNFKYAAMTLGASSKKAFFTITFPLSIPGVASGILLVFVQALGFYVTPMLLGGPQNLMISGLIDRQMFRFLNWPFGATISLVLLVITGLFMIGFDRLFGLETINKRMF